MQVNWVSVTTAVMGGVAATMQQLPYSWAHAAAFGITTAIAGIHLPNTAQAVKAVPSFWKGGQNGGA